MISFEVSTGLAVATRAQALAVPVFEGPEPGPGGAEVGAALELGAVNMLRRNGFRGHLGDVFALESLGRLHSSSVLFVGVGPARTVGPNTMREAAMRAASRLGVFESVATTVPSAGGRRGSRLEACVGAFVEGLLLGVYRFERYRARDDVREGPERLARVQVLVPAGDRTGARAAVRRAQIVASATNWVRDLVNTPASDATPDALAGECRDMAKAHGLTCTVWGKAQLAGGGFGGILGVGQGSANEPRMVELSYSGAAAREAPIAITGKGITFDSGGLSLKKSSEMEWMKSDMAGAAAAMAVIRTAAKLRLRVNLIAAIPFAENLPGGSALRPGDVIRHRGGKTSEVMDTDSEGRLVVADALAYLAEKQPAALVDSATLTDAAGLGESMWAGMGNDRSLLDEIVAAGREAGDPGWPLPLPEEYGRYFDSPVADLRNTPDGPPDTAIMAATYLGRFPGDVPWVHIDNGSTAYLERAAGPWPKGATGSPTRALIGWLERRSAAGARRSR